MKYFNSISILLLLLCVQVSYAQQKPLSLKDYSQWSRIVSPTPSPDGAWFAYALRPNGGDDTLHVKSVQTEGIRKVPYASNFSFSDGSAYFSYFLRPNKAEADKLRKARKPITQTAVLETVKGEELFRVENANAASFSSDERYWMVHRKKADDDKTSHKGADLVLFDIQKKSSFVIGSVSEFAVNKKGTHLAYLVDAQDQIGNGAFLFNLSTKSTQMLDGDAMTYQSLVWDDRLLMKSEAVARGNQLAFLKGSSVDSVEQGINHLLVFGNLASNPVKYELDPNHKGLTTGFVVSEKAPLSFMHDGKAVWFGIKEQAAAFKADKDTLPNVDVWHWKDDYLQSVQIVRANRNRNETMPAVFHFAQDKFVQLADEDMKTVLPSKHARFKIGRDEKPYISDINWGVSPADLYRVDVTTGERVLVEKLINRALQYSPDGKFYLYQKDTVLIAYNLETNAKINVSSKAPMVFMDLEHPYPHEKPPYGVAGWTKDGKHVIVNHKYDLWMLALDGSKATNITTIGDAQEIRFRYINPDRTQEWIDTSKPLWLEAYGEWTKQNGFYELKLGSSPAPVMFVDAMIGNPLKAENADRYFFTRQTFEEFPDYHVSDGKFKNIQKLTDANPQQTEFAWGKRKLVEFTNSKGQRLQGTLTLPANYEEGKAYPTIMYFYEKMSDRHHQYSMPVYDDRPHFSTYASNGYMIFMPDIIFEEGRPGTSSLDAITSAANKLIELGYADKDNIGLQGHSWGGYQTSFILTQTDMFKCIVTGAPPTNLESFYNNLYASTGTVHHGIMEIGQVRMGRGVTPWTHREDYNRENPMYHVPNIKTPFMILHGTKDGAVDWAQGLELYNAARRMDKEVIFLSYPNEGHHLGIEANQKDFQIRMKQYFDYHLMGKDAPEWMERGIPHLEKLYDKVR
ncbi:S9 family peptidase [Mongoliitalea daihaiensis]|uniref:S9 family peptidase n=1 Tax=Mongoliitalea daihaiensis TaxID=2782006 RepID=UPI001F2F968C|nr:prolyl oligopeptidase family serine peptidase [Mongoliitalea daihaiensis]UJP65444.1 S9 family peptidase [Mongoliitalea daihaiensis]